MGRPSRARTRAGRPRELARTPNGAEGTPISCHGARWPNLALSRYKADRLCSLISGDENAAEQVTVLQMRLQSRQGKMEATGGPCPTVGQRAASSAFTRSSVLGDPCSPNLLVLV